MLLTIDIGNSNIVLGLYQEEQCVETWRLVTDVTATVDEYGMRFRNIFAENTQNKQKLTQIILCSVVPEVTDILCDMCEKYFHITPLVVHHDMNIGIKICYENPYSLGLDRLVNAVAAVEKYQAPIIVVDFGTATTFCAVNEKLEYLGGVIVPGVNISLDALVEKTSKLPYIDLKVPKKCIATNTVEGMQSGLLYGYGALTDGLIQRFCDEMHCDAKVVATGGLADIVAQCSKKINIVDENLTMDGLMILNNKNRA